MKCFDAIVVGLGGMGSATVSHLASKGVRVLGLEQFSPMHSKGSSHGESRVIRQSYFEHPNYVPLLLRAYELWSELQAESEIDLMTLTGGLMIGKPDSQTVAGSLRSAQLHKLPHELLSHTEIKQRFPTLTPSADTVGLYESNAGFVRPEKCIYAHLSKAIQSGAELHFNEPILDWSANENMVTVKTERGTYEAGSLVLSPGAWASRLFKLAIPLRTVRQFLFWIEPVRDRQAFAADRFPIYIWEADDSLQFYGFPICNPNDQGIKVAVFYNEQPCEPDEPFARLDKHLVTQIRSCLHDRIPALSGPIVKHLACMYTNTPDHHFVIGVHPKFPRVTLASPCSGHGFKFCSVIGEILSQIAMDGSTPHPIEMFSPTRPSLAT